MHGPSKERYVWAIEDKDSVLLGDLCVGGTLQHKNMHNTYNHMCHRLRHKLSDLYRIMNTYTFTHTHTDTYSATNIHESMLEILIIIDSFQVETIW